MKIVMVLDELDIHLCGTPASGQAILTDVRRYSAKHGKCEEAGFDGPGKENLAASQKIMFLMMGHRFSAVSRIQMCIGRFQPLRNSQPSVKDLSNTTRLQKGPWPL